MDKQRSTKHTYKTKDRVKRTPLKTGGELKFPQKIQRKIYEIIVLQTLIFNILYV